MSSERQRGDRFYRSLWAIIRTLFLSLCFCFMFCPFVFAEGGETGVQTNHSQRIGHMDMQKEQEPWYRRSLEHGVHVTKTMGNKPARVIASRNRTDSVSKKT